MASAPTVVPCPVCGESADRQMSAGAGLVFHGSGFYITDYGKDGKKDQKAAVARNSETKSEPAGEVKSGDSGQADVKSTDSKSDSGSTGATPNNSKSAGESVSKPAETPAKTATPPKASE